MVAYRYKKNIFGSTQGLLKKVTRIVFLSICVLCVLREIPGVRCGHIGHEVHNEPQRTQKTDANKRGFLINCYPCFSRSSNQHEKVKNVSAEDQCEVARQHEFSIFITIHRHSNKEVKLPVTFLKNTNK